MPSQEASQCELTNMKVAMGEDEMEENLIECNGWLCREAVPGEQLTYGNCFVMYATSNKYTSPYFDAMPMTYIDGDWQKPPLIKIRCEEETHEGTEPERVAALAKNVDKAMHDISWFADKGREIGVLTSKKNAAYGDSITDSAKIMSILYPNGVPADQYIDAGAIWRCLDKIKRISSGDKWAFGENPWEDLAGYAIRMSCLDRPENQG